MYFFQTLLANCFKIVQLTKPCQLFHQFVRALHLMGSPHTRSSTQQIWNSRPRAQHWSTRATSITPWMKDAPKPSFAVIQATGVTQIPPHARLVSSFVVD